MPQTWLVLSSTTRIRQKATLKSAGMKKRWALSISLKCKWNRRYWLETPMPKHPWRTSPLELLPIVTIMCFCGQKHFPCWFPSGLKKKPKKKKAHSFNEDTWTASIYPPLLLPQDLTCTSGGDSVFPDKRTVEHSCPKYMLGMKVWGGGPEGGNRV